MHSCSCLLAPFYTSLQQIHTTFILVRIIYRCTISFPLKIFQVLFSSLINYHFLKLEKHLVGLSLQRLKKGTQPTTTFPLLLNTVGCMGWAYSDSSLITKNIFFVISQQKSLVYDFEESRSTQGGLRGGVSNSSLR